MGEKECLLSANSTPIPYQSRSGKGGGGWRIGVTILRRENGRGRPREGSMCDRLSDVHVGFLHIIYQVTVVGHHITFYLVRDPR